MDQARLFDTHDDRPQPPTGPADTGTGRPRVQRPVRDQIQWRPLALEQLLPEDHQARIVWAFVQQLDLAPLYDRIRAVERRAGRPPADPAVFTALWLYATLKGVGSARELDRLSREHLAYIWLRGGVDLDYHTLADFRVGHAELLDRLLTQSAAALMRQGLVSLDRVAQDGLRVRADAGSSSFRRRPTLQRCLQEAQEQVEALRRQAEQDPGGATARQRAARERAARERAERVARAVEELAQVEAKREARKKGSGAEARASTTDPEARSMKMADGGFRPAHNVQFATAVGSQVIVGVDVVNVGGDGGQMAPMVGQIERRYGRPPGACLVDGGFTTIDDIEAVGAPGRGVIVYGPIKGEQSKREAGVDPYAPRPSDGAATAAWRARMGTAAAKEVYKQRAATAECANAQARNRGLYRFRVRGLAKVRAVALWYALAHTLSRMVGLGVLGAAGALWPPAPRA